MTRRAIARQPFSWHRIIIMMVLCLFGICTVMSQRPINKQTAPGSKPQTTQSKAQTAQKKPQAQQKKPGTAQAKKNRQTAKTATKYDDNRVYLLHSDNLHYDRFRNPDAQILDGNVAFRHQGATLYCDSAHFYEKSNSFEAFNNVKMYQGDTLSLFSDYAFYDGNEMMCMARYNVVLKNRESTLYTDSLNYDRLYSVGYFFEGGKLVDGRSTLTSDWGEYNTETKQAVFNYSVKLKGPDYVITSDTLHYDTKTSTAHVLGPSDIYSGTSHITTEDGYYGTKTKKSQLYQRSIIRNQGRIIVGDSVYHDDITGTSEAFNNIIYRDTVNKNMLTSDYCFYNEQTGYGMATKRAVAIDYSQKDSLYMHADTFKLYTFNINTDSVYRKLHAYNKVRAYRVDVQAVCDSLVFNSQDSCLTMYRDPIVWNLSQQLLGEVIKVYMRDSTIDRAHVIGQALSVEQMADSVHFNQVSSKEMKAFFLNGEVHEANAIDNVQIVYYPIDDSDSTLIGLNYTETSEMKMYLENRKMKKIWMPKAEGTLYPMSQIPPAKKFLPNYAWFDYVRPLDKDDIFNWRGKKAGTELKEVKRREAPLQKLAKPDATDAAPETKEGDSGSGSQPEADTQTDAAAASDQPAETADAPAEAGEAPASD
ncbi:MAG: OstA-like protein, partial [Prevotella sp.]|nr:OstA-like protein [Prevotella sp.]